MLAWFRGRPASDFATTSIVEAELRQGIAYMPPGRRRDDMEATVGKLLEEGLGGRVLPFDREAARRYALFAARRRAHGRSVQTFDLMTIAIAAVRGHDVATRNISDFDDLGVPLFNPWDA